MIHTSIMHADNGSHLILAAEAGVMICWSKAHNFRFQYIIAAIDGDNLQEQVDRGLMEFL